MFDLDSEVRHTGPSTRSKLIVMFVLTLTIITAAILIFTFSPNKITENSTSNTQNTPDHTKDDINSTTNNNETQNDLKESKDSKSETKEHSEIINTEASIYNEELEIDQKDSVLFEQHHSTQDHKGSSLKTDNTHTWSRFIKHLFTVYPTTNYESQNQFKEYKTSENINNNAKQFTNKVGMSKVYELIKKATNNLVNKCETKKRKNGWKNLCVQIHNFFTNKANSFNNNYFKKDEMEPSNSIQNSTLSKRHEICSKVNDNSLFIVEQLKKINLNWDIQLNNMLNDKPLDIDNIYNANKMLHSFHELNDENLEIQYCFTQQYYKIKTETEQYGITTNAIQMINLNNDLIMRYEMFRSGAFITLFKDGKNPYYFGVIKEVENGYDEDAYIIYDLQEMGLKDIMRAQNFNELENSENNKMEYLNEQQNLKAIPLGYIAQNIEKKYIEEKEETENNNNKKVEKKVKKLKKTIRRSDGKRKLRTDINK